jgi:mRNA interferase HigB
VISKAAIRKFCVKHPDAREPLMHWYYVTKRARWGNLAEARKDFGHADAVGPLSVFNIACNNYRLVAAVKYKWGVYVRQILTHRGYSRKALEQ